MSSQPKERTACWLSIQILTSSSASTPTRTPTPRRRSARRALCWNILTVPADPAGYRQLIAFGRRHDARLWAIEGTGSFGAGLTTALLARCERIVEVDRPQRPARRGGVKSDDIDAVRSGPARLAGVGLSEPRRRGDREAIRVLLATRAQAVTFRTRAISALHALVTSAPDGIRERAPDVAAGTAAADLRRAARLVATKRGGVRHRVGYALHRTPGARLRAEAAELEAQLDRLVRRLAPELLDQLGIGPVVAGQVITSWSHHGRSVPRLPSPSSAVSRPSKLVGDASPGTD